MSSPRGMVFPRAHAIKVLGQVLADRCSLEDAVTTGSKDLSPSARAWLTEITSGVFRWKGVLDPIIDGLAEKKRPSGKIRRSLLVAAYQVLIQSKVTPAAVVSETVELIKQSEGGAAAGFANALLRKLVARGALSSAAELSSEQIRSSVPAWMLQEMSAVYTPDEIDPELCAWLERPDLWFRRSKEAQLTADWVQVPSTPRGAFKLKVQQDLQRVISSEVCFVQDVSSQQVVEAVDLELRGQKLLPETALIWDRCAAPGGKALGLAMNGWKVFASDRSAPRLKVVSENASRLGLKDQIELGDVPERTPQVIWVDAPCSGIGTVRKHPEIRWIRDPERLQSYPIRQKELVKDSLERLEVGGVLVYSVCTPLRAETTDIRDYLLGLGSECLQERRIRSQDFGGDAFYFGIFRKIAAQRLAR